MSTLESILALVFGLLWLAAWICVLEKAGYSTTSAFGIALLLSIPVVNLGVIAYSSCPSGRSNAKSGFSESLWKAEQRRTPSPLYCQGSRLEAQGNIEAAVAKYEDAIAASPGSEAAQDAEASIRTLRAAR